MTETNDTTEDDTLIFEDQEATSKKIDIEDYLDFISVDLGLAKRTLETYGRQIRYFLAYLRSLGISETAFTTDDIHTYMQKTQGERQLKAKSVNLVLSAIKSYIKYQHVEKIRKDDPMLNYEFPKLEQRIPRILTKEMIDKILAEPNEDNFIELRDKTMIELLYATGLRSSELTNLQFRNINFSEASLRVTGKGEKERLVPIALVTMKLLERYIARFKADFGQFKSSYVFASPKTGLPRTRENLFLRIRYYAKRAGIRPLPSAHVFRHAFATHLLDNGANLPTVQMLLGHASLNTTEIYTHVASKRLHAIFNKAHPRS